MKYLVGAIVYVTAELRRQGFSARTGEIIYKNPRQRLYTIRFPGDKRVRYFAEHEITLVPKAHGRGLSRVPQKPSRPLVPPSSAKTITAVAIILGLSYISSALNSTSAPVPTTPLPAPIATPAPGQQAPAAQPGQPVRYSNQSVASRPNIRIALDPVNVSASAFTVSGQLINEGTVVTVNNIVTVIVYDREGREIGRQPVDLGTLALQTAKPFSASFTGDPSVVGSYKVFKQSKFWPNTN